MCSWDITCWIIKLLGSSDRRQQILPPYFMSGWMDVPRRSHCLISPKWTVPIISNHKRPLFPMWVRCIVVLLAFSSSHIPHYLPVRSVLCRSWQYANNWYERRHRTGTDRLDFLCAGWEIMCTCVLLICDFTHSGVHKLNWKLLTNDNVLTVHFWAHLKFVVVFVFQYVQLEC